MVWSSCAIAHATRTTSPRATSIKYKVNTTFEKALKHSCTLQPWYRFYQLLIRVIYFLNALSAIHNLQFNSKTISMDPTNEVVYLDSHSLTLDLIDDIIKNGKMIDLSKETWRLVQRSREAIRNMMLDPTKAVYGITTGFGSFANVPISKENRKQLQLNLIRSHAIGVGQPVSLDNVRRMIILRINTLAKGRSGIHPQNLRKFILAFNSDFLPYIPEQGTVGASGDLAPLSHLALGLLGEGLAWDQQTKEYVPAEKVLTKLGLTRLQLQEKEGLALINGTQFMTSILSDVAIKTKALFDSSIVLYALATEIFGVDKQLFTEESQQFYQPINSDLAFVIKQVRQLIGSQESELHKKRRSQEEVDSLLDFPQALAGIKRTIDFCNKIIESEMNSATDNPLVYFKQDGFKEDTLVSAGNFHGEYVAKAADFLGVAIFQLAKFSEARIQRYINGRISRLAPFLIKNGGLNSGFMIAQYTTAALLSESKVLVKPASVDSIVTSAGQEDHVSMGGFAARKAETLINNASNICSIQLLLVINALEQLQTQTSSHLQSIINKVRQKIDLLIVDRYFAPDVKTAQGLIFHGLKFQ